MHVDSSQPLIPRPMRPGEPSRGGQSAGSAGASSRGSRLRDAYQPAGGEAAPAARGGPDRIELSSAGRDLNATSGRAGAESPAERAERLEGLSRELAEGRLFSPERLRLAATRMLGGD